MSNLKLSDELICPKCKKPCSDVDNLIEENIIPNKELSSVECYNCYHKFYIRVIGESIELISK